ncbi:hypothetical protein CXF59_01575 [Flavobacterium sp. ALD4]|nr:hypothetical protein CXF59_01575 [Flavobacterium sp. ALD4]
MKVCENQFYCIVDHAIAIEKGSIIVNVGRHFFTSRVCGKFINGGGLICTSDVPPKVLANVAKKLIYH